MTVIDATYLKCPLPVLRLRKALEAEAPGGVLELITTDPVAVVDIPHFCHAAGHEIMAQVEQGSAHHWTIRAGRT
ncbi:MAG: sulfurtransferase TusA family protein [Pseudomonadota bacterium]